MHPNAPGTAAAVQVGTVAPHTQQCPMCGRNTIPDALGLVECACGWGGPDDPLEHTRGLSRVLTRADRRIAAGIARRDLARLASSTWQAGQISGFYTAMLLVASTLVYLLLLALVVGCSVLAFTLAHDGIWLNAAIVTFLAAFFAYALLPRRPALKGGIDATPERFPHLWAALHQVRERTGAPLPQRLVLVPDAEAFVFQQRRLRRFFRRELVLALGAGTLPLLTETDAKALLAHELAHFQYGHTFVARYSSGAIAALSHIINVLRQSFTVQTSVGGRRWSRQSSFAAPVLLAVVLIWVVTLPLRVVFVLLHLLRMAESRGTEFDADRRAVLGFGTQAFVDMYSAIRVANKTLRGSFTSLQREMSTHGSQNIYAELRRHYAALPPQILLKLRADSVRGFRSIEHTHPIAHDRVRAAILANIAPLPDASSQPAVTLLVPAGAGDADAVERELTALLLARRRR